jgi:hypothetical protein
MSNQKAARHYLHQQLLKIDGFGGGKRLEDIDIYSPAGGLITWPSGLSGIDGDPRRKGLYGTAAVCGWQKQGKSMLTLRSAVMAAEDGWQVFVFDAENDALTLNQRLTNVRGQSPRQWPNGLRDRITINRVTSRDDIHSIGRFVSKRLDPECDRVLVCLDSINIIAENSIEKSFEVFQELRRICNWAATCSRESHGRLGFILVSKLNRRGEPMGLDIEYACNCYITMRPAKTEGRVALDFISRSTPGGNLGEHIRLYNSCSFSQPGLSVVRSDVDEEPDDDDVENSPPETGVLPW